MFTLVSFSRLSNFLSKNINNFRHDNISLLNDDYHYNDFYFFNNLSLKKLNHNLKKIGLCYVDFKNINFEFKKNIFEKNNLKLFFKFSNFLLSYFENNSIDNYPSLSSKTYFKLIGKKKVKT
jgi:hypothetical protein